MAARRIFVAIAVSAATQKKAQEWESSYQNLPVRWLAPKNLHVTLIPPWYEDNVERVKSILRSAVGSAKPFTISFDRVEFGPNLRQPRLIWTHGSCPPEILALRMGIARVLDHELEKRPFTTHLTLARFRPEEFSNFPIKNISESVDWREEVGSFVLMESHLYPDGAEYEVLESIDLT